MFIQGKIPEGLSKWVTTTRDTILSWGRYSNTVWRSLVDISRKSLRLHVSQPDTGRKYRFPMVEICRKTNLSTYFGHWEISSFLSKCKGRHVLFTYFLYDGNFEFNKFKFVGKLIFQYISDIEKDHLSYQNVKVDMCYLHISYSMEISNLINLQWLNCIFHKILKLKFQFFTFSYVGKFHIYSIYNDETCTFKGFINSNFKRPKCQI